MSKNSIQEKKYSHFKKKISFSGAQTRRKNDKHQLLLQLQTITNYLKELRFAPKIQKRQLTLHADVCSCWLQSRRFNLSPAGMGIMNCSKLDTRFKKKKKKSLRRQRQVYLEELELERERWRLRPGDLERERRRAGDRLLGDRDLSREKIWTY